MTPPEYHVKNNGTVCMSFDVFRALDPYAISAHLRGNLRGHLSGHAGAERRAHWTNHQPTPRVKILSTVGNARNASNGSPS
jgi:hypothetical protein